MNGQRDSAAPPILAVGLGGSGVHVIRLASDRLLADNDGVMPATIRLLAFDTDPQPAHRSLRTLSADWESTDADLAAPQFHAVPPFAPGAAAQPTAHPGGGRDRPGARALLAQHADLFRIALTRALDSVAPPPALAQRLDTQPTVFVTASLAGATGTGWLLDIALFLARLRQEQRRTFKLIGLLALPSAFEDMPGDQRLRCAYGRTALRELDRFMRSHTPATPYAAMLPLGDPQGAIAIEHRLFDLCYLAENRTDDDASTQAQHKPELACLPALADLIAAHADPALGAVLNEHTKTMIPPSLETAAGRPVDGRPRLYASFNLHAILAPLTTLAESLSLRFLHEQLDEQLDSEDPAVLKRALGEPLRPAELIERLAAAHAAGQAPVDPGLPPLPKLGPFLAAAIGAGNRRQPGWGVQDALAWLDGPQRTQAERFIQRAVADASNNININNQDQYLRHQQSWLAHYLGPQPQRLDTPHGAYRELHTRIVSQQTEACALRVREALDWAFKSRMSAMFGQRRCALDRPQRLAYARELLRSLKTALASAQSAVRAGRSAAEAERQRAYDALLTPGHANPQARLARLRALAEAHSAWVIQRIASQTIEALLRADHEQGPIAKASAALERWQSAIAQARAAVAVRQKLHDQAGGALREIACRTYAPTKALAEAVYPRIRELLLGRFMLGADGRQLWAWHANWAQGAIALAMAGGRRIDAETLQANSQAIIGDWLRPMVQETLAELRVMPDAHLLAVMGLDARPVGDWNGTSRIKRPLVRLTVAAPKIVSYGAWNTETGDPQAQRISEGLMPHADQWVPLATRRALLWCAFAHSLDLDALTNVAELRAAARPAAPGEHVALWPEEQRALRLEAAFADLGGLLGAPPIKQLHPDIVLLLRRDRLRQFAWALLDDRARLCQAGGRSWLEIEAQPERPMPLEAVAGDPVSLAQPAPAAVVLRGCQDWVLRPESARPPSPDMARQTEEWFARLRAQPAAARLAALRSLADTTLLGALLSGGDSRARHLGAAIAAEVFLEP